MAVACCGENDTNVARALTMKGFAAYHRSNFDEAILFIAKLSESGKITSAPIHRGRPPYGDISVTLTITDSIDSLKERRLT